MKPDPNPSQKTPTREQLAVEMVRALSALDWSLEAITAFLVAQNQDGLLRTNCPAWKRQTALFLITHGRVYTLPDMNAAREFAEATLGELRWSVAD